MQIVDAFYHWDVFGERDVLAFCQESASPLLDDYVFSGWDVCGLELLVKIVEDVGDEGYI